MVSIVPSEFPQPLKGISKLPLLCGKRQDLVRRLVLAKADPAKQRIRAWLSDIDDERLFSLGLTPEDVATPRSTASPPA